MDKKTCIFIVADVRPAAIFRIFSGNSSPSMVNSTNVVPIVKNRNMQNKINGMADVFSESVDNLVLSYDFILGGRYRKPYITGNWMECYELVVFFFVLA